MRAFALINQIAYEVGNRYGVLLQLNFPPGHTGLESSKIGHRDLSIIVDRGKEKFGSVSEADVKKTFEKLNPTRFESAKPGQEGFRVQLTDGRIDCLPSGVHLWCNVTPEILMLLDWLFTKAYDLQPH